MLALWTFLLTVLGITSAYASCPIGLLIYPSCTCSIISDTFGEDFALVSCTNINSEDDLMKVLTVTKNERLFEFQIVNSTLNFIPYNAFFNTTFEVLSFVNSSISRLSDTNVAFQGLENSLRLIEIVNCNFVTKWDWSQLSHLNFLMELLITDSGLLDIANGIKTIHHLTVVSFVLERNDIEWLDSYVFTPFEFLTRVALDFNLIQHIERSMFPMPAAHLKILGLKHNRLTDLPRDMFVQMPALSSLYLTGNPLQVIDEMTYRPIWYQLRLFFFRNTKLSCDCRLRWINTMDNSNKHIESECYGPEHVKGRDIKSMQSHELLC